MRPGKYAVWEVPWSIVVARVGHMRGSASGAAEKKPAALSVSYLPPPARGATVGQIAARA